MIPYKKNSNIEFLIYFHTLFFEAPPYKIYKCVLV